MEKKKVDYSRVWGLGGNLRKSMLKLKQYVVFCFSICEEKGMKIKCSILLFLMSFLMILAVFSVDAYADDPPARPIYYAYVDAVYGKAMVKGNGSLWDGSSEIADTASYYLSTAVDVTDESFDPSTLPKFKTVYAALKAAPADGDL